MTTEMFDAHIKYKRNQICSARCNSKLSDEEKERVISHLKLDIENAYRLQLAVVKRKEKQIMAYANNFQEKLISTSK